MTAPTEAEIRDAVADRIRDAFGNVWELLIDNDALDVILDSDHALTRRGWAEGFYPQENHPGTLWADLTEGEAGELNDLLSEAVDPARLAGIVTDAVVSASMEFARRHPDAPRGRYQRREPVTA